MSDTTTTSVSSPSYELWHDGRCPQCGGEDIEGDSWECESNQVWQEVSCIDCEYEWQDVYHLHHMEIWSNGDLAHMVAVVDDRAERRAAIVDRLLGIADKLADAAEQEIAPDHAKVYAASYQRIRAELTELDAKGGQS